MLKISPKSLEDLLSNSWKKELNKEFEKEYFQSICQQIKNTNKAGKLCPKIEDIFNAYNYVNLEAIKVVILGQDPYHGKGQANGFAFAVNKNIVIPASLRNIFKEIKSDIRTTNQINPDLKSFSNQGVFLLNSTLSVEEKKPNSHHKIGWSNFTEKTLEIISTKKENIVFILWGNYAIKKESLINNEKHLILKSSHPSPLSAYKSFFGCKHFSRTNNYLIKHGIKPINWTI